MKKVSKKEAQKRIEDFFSDIDNKNSKEIKKILNLAKNNNIKLANKRKLFCKKCMNPYKNPKIRINKGIKSTECKNCNYKSKWKIKLS
jgi:RNase P subunit RPR2